MEMSREEFSLPVTAGLVPATYVFRAVRKQDVDARNKPGHETIQSAPYSAARLAALENFFITRSRLSFDR
jgi:hypothetical protein